MEGGGAKGPQTFQSLIAPNSFFFKTYLAVPGLNFQTRDLRFGMRDLVS